MSYTVFARKYRPQTFADVVGQDHITTTLRNAIEQKRLAHAYMFVGPRGTGKTSTARILAKALNCVQGPTTTPCGTCDTCREIAAGTSLDVLEFDAASNTGVDKIREIIIENVKYAPSRGQYKVYIVDEVHMLSNSSFNALLKTLEEPPAHVKFVFATTDPQKVPTTILSRCQRFDLKRIPTALIAEHLQLIAQKENLQLSPQASEALARGADGGMRDAESMLDQLVAFCGNTIEEDDVLRIFGFTALETISTLCSHLVAGQVSDALHIVQHQAAEGKDLGRFLGDLIQYLHSVLIAKADSSGLTGEFSPETLVAMEALGSAVSLPKLLELVEELAKAEQQLKRASDKKLHLEIAVIRAAQTLQQASLSEVLDTLGAFAKGTPLPPSPAPATKPPVARTTVTAPEPRAAKPRSAPAAEDVPQTPSKKPVPEVSTAPVQPPAAPAPAEVAPPRPVSEAVAAPAVSSVAKPVPPPVAPADEKPTQPESSKVEEKPVQAAPPEESPKTAPETEQFWPALCAELKRQRPLMSMWIESGSFLGVSGTSATIGFAPEHALAVDYCEQPANRKFIEETAKLVSGVPLAFKFVSKEGIQVTPPPPPPPPKDPMAEFKNDPLIKKALELFKAEIEPV